MNEIIAAIKSQIVEFSCLKPAIQADYLCRAAGRIGGEALILYATDAALKRLDTESFFAKVQRASSSVAAEMGFERAAVLPIASPLKLSFVAEEGGAVGYAVDSSGAVYVQNGDHLYAPTDKIVQDQIRQRIAALRQTAEMQPLNYEVNLQPNSEQVTAGGGYSESRQTANTSVEIRSGKKQSFFSRLFRGNGKRKAASREIGQIQELDGNIPIRIRQICDPFELSCYAINLESPDLKKIVQRSEQIIRDTTGLVPGDPRLGDPRNKEAFYKAIIEKIVPIFESEASSANYSAARNQLRTVRGIDHFSTILMSKAAVCEELATLAHILSAHYGITSRFMTLIVPTGGHAVLLVDKMIIDFNYARRLQPMDQYLKAMHAKFDPQLNIMRAAFEPLDQ